VNIGLLLELASEKIYISILWIPLAFARGFSRFLLCYCFFPTTFMAQVLKFRVQLGFGVSPLARPNLHNFRE